jgi:acetate kinase
MPDRMTSNPASSTAARMPPSAGQVPLLLVFNAGSATLKCAAFDADGNEVMRGVVPALGKTGRIEVRDAAGNDRRECEIVDHAAAARLLLRAMDRRYGGRFESGGLLAVAHRVVHGGVRASAAVRLDDAEIARLRALTPLAPLHQPVALAVVDAVRSHLGDAAPAFALFDGAYFSDLPEAARTYALPRATRERFGIQRLGFHGYAHRSLFENYCRHTGAEPTRTRVITLQLGQGCSAAAIAGGRPRATSMGFTPLEGLVMGSRGGDLDPGVLVHLLRQGVTIDELDTMLQRNSGLLGLAGSNDMRVVLEQARTGQADAQLAVEVFCTRVRHYLGGYLACLDGADAIVIGGGIGEHAAEIRRRCLDGFGWAGLRLDTAGNARGGPRLSTEDSTLGAYVLGTNEEAMMVRDLLAILDASTETRR